MLGGGFQHPSVVSLHRSHGNGVVSPFFYWNDEGKQQSRFKGDIGGRPQGTGLRGALEADHREQVKGECWRQTTGNRFKGDIGGRPQGTGLRGMLEADHREQVYKGMLEADHMGNRFKSERWQ